MRLALNNGDLALVDGNVGRVVVDRGHYYLYPIPGFPEFRRVVITEENWPGYYGPVGAEAMTNIVIVFAAAANAVGISLTAVEHDMGMSHLGPNQLLTFEATPVVLNAFRNFAEQANWTEARRNIVCYRLFGITFDMAASRLSTGAA